MPKQDILFAFKSNRIVFQNPGRFYIDISNLPKSAISKPRNPLIARAFRWAKLAENAGFGFDKMLVWKHKVKFETKSDYSEVTFFLEENNSESSEKSSESSEKSSENSEKSSEKIISIIRNNPFVTIEELAILLNKTTRTIEKNLSSLKNKGLLERVGPDKGGHWKVCV